MSSDGSVTRWLAPLQAGDPTAVEELWKRYFQRLVGLARKKLRGAVLRAADEEDVALSAFDSFCRNAAQGRFPHLLDRDSLWHLAAFDRAEAPNDTRHLGKGSRTMNESSIRAIHELSSTLALRVDRVCNQFEGAWRESSTPRIEDFLAHVGGRFAERMYDEK